MSRFFDPVVEKFIDAIRRALPGCDDRDLYWAYHFLSGALALTFAETGRIDELVGWRLPLDDLDSVHERLVPCCAAGLRALCAPKRTGHQAGPSEKGTRVTAVPADSPGSAPMPALPHAESTAGAALCLSGVLALSGCSRQRFQRRSRR